MYDASYNDYKDDLREVVIRKSQKNNFSMKSLID